MLLFVEGLGIRVMVFNATFNNITVISWWSVLLVEELGVRRENHRPATSHQQILSHNFALSTPRMSGFKHTTSVVIRNDCTGSCKSNYHKTMTRTVPQLH